MSLLFLVFIHNAALIASGLNINIANKQRYLIVRIQAAPEELCKRIDVIRDCYQLRLTLKARERIAVVHVGMDEMSLTSHRIFVSKGIAVAGIRVAVVAL